MKKRAREKEEEEKNASTILVSITVEQENRIILAEIIDDMYIQ